MNAARYFPKKAPASRSDRTARASSAISASPTCCKDRVAAPDALSVRDGATGRELTRLPLGTWIAERHGSPYWTAHRKDLHAALRTRAEAEPLITLKTGVEIVIVRKLEPWRRVPLGAMGKF